MGEGGDWKYTIVQNIYAKGSELEEANKNLYFGVSRGAKIAE